MLGSLFSYGFSILVNLNIPCDSRDLCNFLCPITQELHRDLTRLLGDTEMKRRTGSGESLHI